jgi:titin
MAYNWTGQSCGFKAKFYARAFNNAGESDSSKSVAGVTIPCQPGHLIANASGNTISFNWSVDASHNEAGFRIYQQGVSAPVATRGPNLGSGGTIYDLTGLPCNLVATYSVTAFNDAGESPASNLVQSEAVPCGPSGFTITGTAKDTVQYSWSDNSTNETGFHIYQDDILYATLPANLGTGTLSNDAFQICGTTHVYSVRAFNYAGESVTSEHVGATTLSC